MLDAVDGLNEWNMLGLNLGLHYSTLMKIKNDHQNMTDMCTMAMLAAWLKQRDDVYQIGSPSWTILQNALRKIGENTLADRIESMYTPVSSGASSNLRKRRNTNAGSWEVTSTGTHV